MNIIAKNVSQLYKQSVWWPQFSAIFICSKKEQLRYDTIFSPENGIIQLSRKTFSIIKLISFVKVNVIESLQQKQKMEFSG